MMQMDKLTNSALAMGSPRNKKAIIVANIGDVLFRNATFDKEISFTAMLKTKKVIVPDIDLMITSLH
jgi:hypothetical protein